MLKGISLHHAQYIILLIYKDYIKNQVNVSPISIKNFGNAVAALDLELICV
jgi:hypothetical protein